MSKVLKGGYENEFQKRFLKTFEKLAYRHSPWSVWSDFILMSAISISSCLDESNREAREKTYQSIAKKYSGEELDLLASLLAVLVEALEVNPNQDFLGAVYMKLNLGNDNTGQFFTPYHVCELMAKMTSVGKVEDWISVNDPACGAGGLLIAYANECRSQHVNYQTSVLFVGQDIDPVVGLMCYIQLSLLGCPGYVVIDDSIKNPIQSYDSKGLLPVMSERVWLTPVFFHSIWIYRRMVARLKLGDHKPQGEVPEVKA